MKLISDSCQSYCLHNCRLIIMSTYEAMTEGCSQGLTVFKMNLVQILTAILQLLKVCIFFCHNHLTHHKVPASVALRHPSQFVYDFRLMRFRRSRISISLQMTVVKTCHQLGDACKMCTRLCDETSFRGCRSMTFAGDPLSTARIHSRLLLWSFSVISHSSACLFLIKMCSTLGARVCIALAVVDRHEFEFSFS